MPPKSALRLEAKARREQLSRACPGFAATIATCDLALPQGATVAGYSAIGDEADPSALMLALAACGHPLALPRVVAKGMPLIFHAWRAGDALIAGAYGIPEPSPDAPEVKPDVLLVPLLAFDAAGYRLGYGGGFYDRTIAALPGVRTIGIAFAGQEVETVPREAFDARLSAVLTESGLRRIQTVSGL